MTSAKAVATRVRALILHGFTGNLHTVRALAPMCEARGLSYAMPLLRGHGTVPEDLVGVTWHDWYADAERALLDLSADGARVIVFGLSMGGLVTLDLAARHPDRIAGVVTIAAALALRSPLLPLLPVIGLFTSWWSGKPEATLSEPAAYDRFPLCGLRSLLEYQEVVTGRLGRVQVPLLAVQSWSDQTVKPVSARRIIDGVASRDKELARFSRARHDMLLGCEKEAVVARIGAWVDARLPVWRGI